MKLFPLLTLALSCALPAASVAANARYASSAVFQQQWIENKSQTEQRISVGQTLHPITIDGKIRSDEWQDASEISGLIDKSTFNGALYQTHIWMTYDRRYLYFAMQSLMPETAKRVPADLLSQTLLRSRAIADDTNVDFDDSISLDIIPRYPDGNLYKLYTNNIGTKYDYMFHHPGNVVDVKWDPQWRIKSSVTAGSWNMEIAIPIEAFGVNSIKTGETWAVNVGRIWRMMRHGVDQWGVGGAADANPKLPWRLWPFGLVQFEGTQNIIINDQGISGLLDGNLVAHLLLRNRKQIPAHLTAQLSLSSKVLLTRGITMDSGKSQPVTLKADLTQAMAGLLDLTVRDENGKVLFQQQLPYKPQNGLDDVDIKSYPSSNRMQTAWELCLPQSEVKHASLAISLQDTNKQRPAIIKHVPLLNSLKGSTDFNTISLPNGQYHVVVTLIKDGKAVASRQLDYDKKPLPSWIGNQYGISKNPPPPWTPIEVKSDQVNVWNRQIQYDDQLFPAQIINKKLPMLAEPIRLSVQEVGRKALSSNSQKATVQWLQKNPSRVTSKRAQRIGDVQITSTSYTEFDGMTWIELEVTPDHPNMRLQNLTFTIPLKKDWAKLINTYDYTLRTTGKLPDNGWQGRLRPLWLGNGDGGVQFFAETDATWRGSKQLSVRRQGNAVFLQAHLIDTPTTIHQPLKFAFGYITTPVKPTPSRHRDWRVISGYGRKDPVREVYFKTLAARNSNIQIFDIWNQGWWLPATFKGNPDSTGFLPVPGNSAKPSYLEQTADGYEVRRSLYGRISQIGINNPWFRQFGDEWTLDKNIVFNLSAKADSPFAQAEVSAASASYRDFVAWGYHQLLSKHRVPGLYFDVSDVVEDNNTYHGGGVDTSYGTAIPTQNILGQREIFKRIYTMLKQHDPKAMIFHHMSGHVLMPVDSFVDAQVDGENFNSLLSRSNNSGYEQVLSLDQFRAEYAGQNNFGPVGVFLDEMRADKNDGWKKMRSHGDYLIGMVLLHDSVDWWSWMPSEYYADMYSAMDSVGVDSSFSFIPYWHQRALTLPPEVVASFYVSPQRNKAAIIVLNASDKDQRIDLKIDAKMVGLNSNQLNYKVLYPLEVTAIESQSVKVQLPAYGVRIIEVDTE